MYISIIGFFMSSKSGMISKLSLISNGATLAAWQIHEIFSKLSFNTLAAAYRQAV